MRFANETFCDNINHMIVLLGKGLLIKFEHIWYLSPCSHSDKNTFCFHLQQIVNSKHNQSCLTSDYFLTELPN